MPKTGKFRIPDDYNPVTDDWGIGLFCYPNTRKWRATIRGIFNQLQRARSWDEATGNVVQAASIGRRVFDGMDFCGIELVKALRETNAILAGLARNLETDLPETVDYESVGLAPALYGNSTPLGVTAEAINTTLSTQLSGLAEALAGDTDSIGQSAEKAADSLEAIRLALEGQEDIEDELQQIGNLINLVLILLGGV